MKFTFANGATFVAPYGQKQLFQFTGTWGLGDTYYVSCVSTQGDFTIGKGYVSGTNPVYGITIGGRVFVCSGSQYNFCDNDDPTKWEEQNPGAGFVGLLSSYGIQDVAMSLASYQGQLAVLMKQTIQIWVPNADPSQFALKQTLPNIGTIASFSTQSLGDWDVLFLAKNGIRSLRVRDSSLNALVVDIGTQIDSIIQNALLTAWTDAPCSIVDPATGRYWLFLQSGSTNTIYVLSYYPNAGITAWSTYKPTYAVLVEGVATQTEFVPKKMLAYAGRVYVRGTVGGTTDYIFLYGGTANNSYDGCVATVRTPWLSAKEPSTNKLAMGVDVACRGTWSVALCQDPSLADPFAAAETSVISGLVDSTYDRGGIVGFQSRGTHFCFQATSTDATVGPSNAILSGLTLLFEGAEIR